MVVARLEAFITGYGLDEAYRRADAYHKAGADAILCHSKKKDDSDIKAFMEAWGTRCPVVIVPTKYPDVHCDTFRDYDVSMVRLPDWLCIVSLVELSYHYTKT